MEDSSEDLPKPPRRTAARPFMSPRPNSGEGVTGPLDLSRRRGPQLFTPPSSSLASSRVDKVAPNHAESIAKAPPAPASDAEVAREGDWSSPPMIAPERTLDAESLLSATNLADDDRLIVEMFEHEEIELNATSSVGDEHSIEVIAYDDANSLLKAAANEGKHPKVDGLQLETTEFSFEQEPPPPRMNVDSFWASAPFATADEPQASAEPASQADETEAQIDAETAAEPTREQQASASPYADIAPPWRHRLTPVRSLTPVSSQALEEIKEAEPWDLAPQELEMDLDEFEASSPSVQSGGAETMQWDVSAPESAPAEMAVPEMVTSVPSALDMPVSEVAPSDASSYGAAPSEPAPADNYIADALMRIAARVRDGELDVPAGAGMSDEAVLSVVLTSLLRMRH